MFFHNCYGTLTSTNLNCSNWLLFCVEVSEKKHQARHKYECVYIFEICNNFEGPLWISRVYVMFSVRFAVRFRLPRRKVVTTGLANKVHANSLSRVFVNNQQNPFWKGEITGRWRKLKFPGMKRWSRNIHVRITGKNPAREKNSNLRCCDDNKIKIHLNIVIFPHFFLSLIFKFKGGPIVSSWCHMDTILTGESGEISGSIMKSKIW